MGRSSWKIAVLLAAGACGASVVDADEVWTASLEGAGVSSPRVTDVDGDGVLDVVIGAGKEEMFGTVAALNGATGELLWSASFGDEVYATPCLLRIDDDAVPDVVIGRRKRSGGVAAFGGRDGAKLWGIRPANPDIEFPPTHFNTAIPCPDLDGDGRRDLICLQGGGADHLRPVGILYVVSGATGRVLHRYPMPDGKESYFVPGLERSDDGWRLLIGTGGETVPGHLISLEFPSLQERWRVASKEKGFVAGTTQVDLDGDGRRDVLAVSFDSTLMRLDGDTGAVEWSVERPGFETYVTPVPGRFDDDDVLDVVCVFSEGTWPRYDERAIVAWFSGADGALLGEHEFGKMCSTTPAIADLDGDGFDEVVLMTNMAYGRKRKQIESRLAIFDGRTRAMLVEEEFMGTTATTPWLGDLDGDGNLDLVIAWMDHVARVELSHAPDPAVRFGEYRGKNQDGVLRSGGG